MKKAEFVGLVAEQLGKTKKETGEILDVVFGTIEKALVEHGEVPLGDLGKFIVKEQAGRTGRNPQTGEPIDIPARNVVKYKASKHAKELV